MPGDQPSPELEGLLGDRRQAMTYSRSKGIESWDPRKIHISFFDSFVVILFLFFFLFPLLLWLLLLLLLLFSFRDL